MSGSFLRHLFLCTSGISLASLCVCGSFLGSRFPFTSAVSRTSFTKGMGYILSISFSVPVLENPYNKLISPFFFLHFFVNYHLEIVGYWEEYFFEKLNIKILRSTKHIPNMYG